MPQLWATQAVVGWLFPLVSVSVPPSHPSGGGMRKIWIALACAVVAALSVAAVASAVNTYEVDIAKATKGKGSKNKPKPARLAFGYEVDDSEDLRPEVIRQYRIAAE